MCTNFTYVQGDSMVLYEDVLRTNFWDWRLDKGEFAVGFRANLQNAWVLCLMMGDKGTHTTGRRYSFIVCGMDMVVDGRVGSMGG
jgi:hypothetical protein